MVLIICFVQDRNIHTNIVLGRGDIVIFKTSITEAPKRFFLVVSPLRGGGW